MGGLRSFTRTRPGGETSSSSASRGNIGSRSCGRLRQTISRAKHQKRESDTKARCKGRGPQRAAGRTSMSAPMISLPLLPAGRWSRNLAATYIPRAVMSDCWQRIARLGRDRCRRLGCDRRRGSRSALEIARRTGSFPLARARLAMSQTTARCLLPTLNCSRVSMTRATRRPLTKVTTRSSISPSIRDEICE